jgi:hypothetical protein
MALTATQINKLIAGWAQQGPSIAAQMQAILQILNQTSIDATPVLGPTLLLAQGYAQAQVNVLGFIMNDPTWSDWSIPFQSEIARQMNDWTDLSILFGNIATQQKLPLLENILQASPASRYYGIQSVVASLDIALESFLNVPTLAGITVATFWSTTAPGVDALARLLALDYVLSSDPTYYYGPTGTISSIINDAAQVLVEVVPLNPNVTNVLNALTNATVDGFSAQSVISLQTVAIKKGDEIEKLALTLLGNADLWTNLVDFNNLMWPYISDDPIDQLGRPESEDIYLGDDAAIGDTTITLANDYIPVYSDQRIALRCADNVQVVTVVDGSANPMIKIAAPINVAFPADTTEVGLYPPVYDTGVVLGTGGMLLVPSTLSANGSVVSTMFTDAQRFGTDILLDAQGNIHAVNGDLDTVVGKPNLLQALNNRFKVPRNSLTHLHTYGNGLQNYLGLKNTPYYGNLKVVDAIQTALQDPRVPQVQNATAQIIDDETLISFDVPLNNQQLLLPVQLDLPVD